MSEWFYSDGATRRGPVPEAELRSLVMRDELKPDHLVWKAGMADWIEARHLDGLFANQPPPLPTQRHGIRNTAPQNKTLAIMPESSALAYRVACTVGVLIGISLQLFVLWFMLWRPGSHTSFGIFVLSLLLTPASSTFQAVRRLRRRRPAPEPKDKLETAALFAVAAGSLGFALVSVGGLVLLFTSH